MLVLSGLIVSLLAVLAPSPAGAEPLNPGTLGGFENEGDQDDATLNTGNIDWETVKTDPRITQWALIHDDGDVDTQDATFLDSSKEQDPTTWGCAANESPPKDDLFRLYLASQISQQAQFLHIGYVREKPQGDTDINIEFNRVTGDFSCPGNEGRVRSRDDLMLSFTFGGGNDPSVIEVFRWDPTAASDGAGDPDPSVTGDDFVPADGHWDRVALAPNVAVGADNATFGDDNGEPLIKDQFFDDGLLDPRQFGEVTLDLGTIFGGGLLGCPGIGFVTGHSRASHSFASDLKDIFPETPFDLSNCAKVKIKKVDNSVPPVATSGAVYGLYDSLAKAQAVAGQTDAQAIAAAVSTCTTVADGTCLLTDADPSKDYWITEITPPAGLLPSAEIRAIDDADIDPFETVDLTGTPFVNNVPVGNVTITKRLFEDDNNNGVLDPGEQVTPDQMSDLDGIKFELQQGNPAATAKTHPGGADAACTITGGTGQCTISSVRLGTYSIKETLNPNGPSGVGLGSSPSVTIDENGETVAANYDNPLSPINIALDKAGPDFAEVGQQITYTFDVTTTGVPLTITQLLEVVDLPNDFDDRCDAGTPLTGPDKSTTIDPQNDGDAKLELGETWRWTCKHVVTLADATDDDGTDLMNKAHVDGKDDVGRTVSADDIHKVVIKLPDLSVTKLAADGVDAGSTASDDETIDAPGTASYSIVVTNVGTGVAQNATLTDTLPAGSWTASVASPDGDDVCPVGGNPVSGSFSCTFGSLAAGASKTVTVSRSVSIGADCADTLENGVAVATTSGGADIDLNSANDTDSASITVRCPDVEVTKSATNSPVSAGQAIQWSITVRNLGAGVAQDVHLRDPQPAQVGPMQLSGADAAACGFENGDLVCDFGDLPGNDGAPGGPDTRTVTISTLTDASDCGIVPNTASLRDAQGAAYVDSNLSNNSSTANATVLCPDLKITKVADLPATVTAGDPVGFTITVTNDGPGTALGATLNDPLPAGDGISWSIESQSGGAACAITGSAPSQTLTCGPKDLADDASFSVHVVSDTDPSGAECVGGTLANTGTADAANDDPVTASATVTVQCPNLSITKVADADPVTAGSPIGFTVTVTNSNAAGTGTATAVTLNDPLPAGDGVSWSVQSQSGGAGCAVTGTAPNQTLTCGPKDLAPGASFSVHVVSGTTPSGVECASALLSNKATADPSNDGPVDASDTVTIQCPNLTITKTADAASVSAGEPVGFSISVTNTGPGTALGATLSDPLPEGVTWSIAGQTGGASCGLTVVDGQQVLGCGPIDLGVDQGFTVHVTAQTTEDDCALYENTATADSANDGPVTASDDTLVKCPGLNIVKDADDPETVTAGDQIGFVITVSNEPGEDVGTALGVTLDDPLPAGDGIDWVIESQSGGASCTIDGDAPDQTLECGPKDLAPGASFSVHVVSDTDPSDVECTSATLTNTGTADATNTAPKQATDSVEIQCPDLSLTKVADDDLVDAGDTIGFTILVHNDGPGIARDVAVTDPLPSAPGVTWTVSPAVDGCSIALGALLCTVGDMAAGADFQVHVQATTPGELGDPNLPAVCKQYDNTATATPSNDGAASGSDSTEVQCPLDITIEKDGPDLAHRGDEITYTFDVTNSGAADLVTVELADPICDDGTLTLVDDADGDTVLAIGETWSYECTRVIREDDPDPLPNTAAVVGTDVRDRTTDDTDDHVVDIINPAIEIVKTVNDDLPDVGETVTFTYVVTNTGDTTLFGVDVVDDQLGPVGTIDELEAGESATLTMDMVVAEDSPTRNVAVAEGEDQLGKSVSDDDDATITIVLGEVLTPAQPLPTTGFDPSFLLQLAGVLMIAGGALLMGSRPRRRTA